MRRVRRRNHFRRAIFVDVDGTLVGPYRDGRRQLRSSAASALRALSEHAPVFLWSIAGPDNPRRLLQEFPELEPFVADCSGKQDFPLDQVDEAYAIDDEALDDAVLRCEYWILSECYNGGPEASDLSRAVEELIARIRQRDGVS